jgi:hypothetical protein
VSTGLISAWPALCFLHFHGRGARSISIDVPVPMWSHRPPPSYDQHDIALSSTSFSPVSTSPLQNTVSHQSITLLLSSLSSNIVVAHSKLPNQTFRVHRRAQLAEFTSQRTQASNRVLLGHALPVIHDGKRSLLLNKASIRKTRMVYAE